MALPIKWSLPSLSEITSPSAGFPNTFRTSLENTQSCPCKIRARGLTTIPAMENSTSNALRPTSNVQLLCHSERSRGISRQKIQRCLDFAQHDKTASELKNGR